MSVSALYLTCDGLVELLGLQEGIALVLECRGAHDCRLLLCVCWKAVLWRSCSLVTGQQICRISAQNSTLLSLQAALFPRENEVLPSRSPRFYPVHGFLPTLEVGDFNPFPKSQVRFPKVPCKLHATVTRQPLSCTQTQNWGKIPRGIDVQDEGREGVEEKRGKLESECQRTAGLRRQYSRQACRRQRRRQ
jgi:hypothetical protein